jgi:hypothetical protein
MPPSPPPIYSQATELADLGALRLDHDTAAPGDRDYALLHPSGAAHTVVTAGRAPRGLESQVFAWNAFKFTTEERSARDDAKADLHEGQLHRLNRAAGGGGASGPGGAWGGGGAGAGMGGRGWKWGGGGGGGSKGGKMGGKMKESSEEGLCAGRKPDGVVSPPLAKGAAEELAKDLFWDGEIV